MAVEFVLPVLPGFPDRARRISRCTGWGIALLGLAVLLGWAFDVRTLKSVLPGLVSMKANTALCFLLCGVVLALEPHSPQRRRFAASLSTLVGLLAGLTLIEYVCGIDFRIDQAFWSDDPAAVGNLYPGRMSPATTVGFLLFSIWSLGNARGALLRQTCAFGILAIAWLALLGYIYDVPMLRGVRAITEIALHTVLGLLTVGAALLLADPEQGAAQTVFSATTGGALARRTVPLLLLLPAGMGWVRLEWQRVGGLGLESGLAIYTLANTLVLGGGLAWLARRLAWVDVERARAYDDLQQERDRLELRVGERTAELVQANAELHARSRTLADFKAALDQHANVTLTDASGMIVYVNDAYAKVSGYTREELLGKTHRLLRSGHHAPGFVRDLWTTIAAGRVWKGEFLNRAKDGRLHWMDTTVVPFLGPDGKPAQYISIQTEITDRKQAEERNAQLTRDVQQRAAQLEAANRELEAFTYSVSHDLRAPLRHVHGYAEMLGAATGAQLPDRARHCLDTIVAAVTEMGQLIDDLLDFSRVRQTSLAESTIVLDDLVREVIRGLHGATQGRNIAWEVGPLPPVAGDPSLLKQALANLLGNAVKYTRKRDAARIEVACIGEEAGRLVFRVRDNGTGFDMKYVHKLFGVFQRLHRAEEFEGTGIGLAIVHRVIDRHGGRVWAESTLGAGASFHFTLKPAGQA